MSEEMNKNDEIRISSSKEDGEAPLSGSKTISEIECEFSKDKKIKNLVAAVILLAGLAVGSIFVDVAQFVTGGGFSNRALRDAQIIPAGDKTWVAYGDPKVDVIAISASEEELKSCPKCDPAEVLTWTRRIVPTIDPRIVDASSDEGKDLIEKYGIKTIPAFIYGKKIKDTSFYEGEGRAIFEEKEGKFVFNASAVGVPIGKYLETPGITEEDAVIGNKDAKVKMVIFSDFQCPYCKIFFSTITKVAREYGDKVALVYKEMPLEDIHPQARTAALASECAKEQGKFWEMSDLIYKDQKIWGNEGAANVMKSYARQLGLKADQFNKCLDEEKYGEKIDKDLALAQEYGISGTPSGFIGGQFIGGVAQEDEIKRMIDEELAK